MKLRKKSQQSRVRCNGPKNHCPNKKSCCISTVNALKKTPKYYSDDILEEQESNNFDDNSVDHYTGSDTIITKAKETKLSEFSSQDCNHVAQHTEYQSASAETKSTHHQNSLLRVELHASRSKSSGATLFTPLSESHEHLTTIQRSKLEGFLEKKNKLSDRYCSKLNEQSVKSKLSDNIFGDQDKLRRGFDSTTRSTGNVSKDPRAIKKDTTVPIQLHSSPHRVVSALRGLRALDVRRGVIGSDSDTSV